MSSAPRQRRSAWSLALASGDVELSMGGRVRQCHLGAGLARPQRVRAGIRVHAMLLGALVAPDAGAENAAAWSGTSC